MFKGILSLCNISIAIAVTASFRLPFDSSIAYLEMVDIRSEKDLSFWESFAKSHIARVEDIFAPDWARSKEANMSIDLNDAITHFVHQLHEFREKPVSVIVVKESDSEVTCWIYGVR